MDLKDLDVVEYIGNSLKGIPRGLAGVILFTHKNSNTFEVEFVHANKPLHQKVDVRTVNKNELKFLRKS